VTGGGAARLRTGALAPRRPTTFDLQVDAAGRAAIARDLGLLALDMLRLTGTVTPRGRDELVLEARLRAVADQACVVSLAPVPVRLDEGLRRRYVAGLALPEGDEVEMPEDPDTEAMPDEIDLAAVAAEALALALPLYPRAPGAELGQTVHAAEGVPPLTDAALKPFAGLAGLAAKLGGAKDRDPGETG
jgi:uncharacterized metal-binding protein YceD (DUF177 family)